MVPCENSNSVVPVTFRRRLFKGDALSPLVFCLVIAPLSSAVQEDSSPSISLTHILYMDDLKLYAQDNEELGATITVAESAAKAVEMELGAEKRGVAYLQSIELGGSGNQDER